MIQKIKSCKILIPYLRNEIEDEGIMVGISDDIDKEKIAIIKVDDYYRSLRLALTPKAVDHLVIVDCECDSYVMYLLELKNVSSPKYLDIKSIQEKFDNTIKDFLSDKFAEIFLNDRFKYKKIMLYLISDAYGISGKYDDFNKYRQIREKTNKRDSLKIELNLGSKLFRFKGKILKIMYDIPPNPVISKIS